MDCEIYQLNIPDDIDLLANLAFDDEPEGTFNITITATKLYNIALKAYPDYKIVDYYEDKENN